MNNEGNDGLQRTVRMYEEKVFGHKVSEYGLSKGYLDYQTLAKMVGDQVRCNSIFNFIGYENWDLANGVDDKDIFQYFIITYHGFDVLNRFTDEIVYYNEDLDIFLWGITHFGTGWDYVLTDIKLIDRSDRQ